MRIADRVVIFNSAYDKGKGPISFKVPGAGTVNLLVTDLAAGEWHVSRDGAGFQPLMVGEEGTAYFSGPAGTFVLSR